MLKRILYGSVVLLVLVGIAVAIAATLFVRHAGKTGSGTIEQWVGGQLQQIANSYLNPRLSFQDLDYEYPGTVRLRGFKLTADDPMSPGKSVDILGSDEAVITLAEIPSIGQPIVIERVVLTRPLFQAIAAAPESDEFVGFSNLLRAGADGDDTSSSSASKLSDTFRMRQVELVDGRIVYDPRLPDTAAMELDQINTRLDIEPADAGWYKLNTTLSRKPIFDMTIAGRLNLDDFSADQLDVKLDAQLARDNDRYLPPQVQQTLRAYEVEGKLALHITGNVPITDARNGKLQTSVDLTDAHVSFDEYQVPVREMTVRANLADRIVHVPTFQVKALDGQASAIAFVALNDTLETDVKLNVIKMKLQDTLRKGSAQQAEAKYSGVLSADVQASVPMAYVIAAAAARESSSPMTQPSSIADAALPADWGSGTIRITEGRIINLPLLDELVSATPDPSSAKGNSARSRPRDNATIAMTMSRGQIQLNQMDFNSDVIVARGRGTIDLDQDLDLTLNGGPLERVEAMLGDEVGSAMGAVTDAVGSYRVTGTLSEPHVTYDVGDGLIDETATLAKDTAGAVTEAAKEAPEMTEGVSDVAKEAGSAAKEGASAIGEGAKEVGKGIKDLFGF
jgi:hypothetical protein